MTEANWMRLLSGLRQQQRWAYTELYEIHAREVYFFVRRLVGDEPTAEDITSESFVKTFQHYDGYIDGSAFRAFLFTVARNRSLDILKSRARRGAHEEHILKESSTVSDQDIERQLITAEFIQLLADEIEALPEHCRNIIRLSIIEEKSVSEIADELGVPLKTVKNNKTKGLQLLRAQLLKSRLLPLSFLLIQRWFA